MGYQTDVRHVTQKGHIRDPQYA